MVSTHISKANFKTLNDSLGHLVGDEALARVATEIEATMRTSDAPARLGGEEFAIALPMTDAAGAELSANRLRERIGEIVVGEPPRRLSASVGVVQYQPGEPLSATLARADDALRRAKAEGRNRVVVL